MTSIALVQENSLTLPSGGELGVKYKLEPAYALLAEVPKDFLPDLCDMYAFMEHLLLSAQRSVVQFPCSLKTLEAFLDSAEYCMLRDQFGNKEVATDEDAEKVIKTIISSHSLPQNISPQILAEVFMEIIRELRPSKAALHFTRLSIRNRHTFVPSSKEFRDTLIQAMHSVSTLAEMTSSLPQHVDQRRTKVGRTK
jgi:hypothetical protein